MKECSGIDSRRLPREHPHSFLLYGSSSRNTKEGKALQAWISRNKLSSPGFASRSFLFALHAEISTFVLWGNLLSVSFIELPLLFCLLSPLIHHTQDLHSGFPNRACWERQQCKAPGSIFRRSNNKPGDSESNTAPFHVKFKILTQIQDKSIYAGLCFKK